MVYMVSLADGQLLLGGRMTVKRIVSRDQAVKILHTDNLHEADEHIIGEESDGTPLNLHRRLASAVSRQLRFVSPNSKPKGLRFVSDTHLDTQATPAIRELTPESAALLDRIIEVTDRLPRSDQLITVTEELLRSGKAQEGKGDIRLPEEIPENGIVAFLNELFKKGIPERRAAPDNLRRGRFQAGWEDFTKKRKKYDELDYLTWQNLGNRCGVRYGDQPREQIRKVYDIAAGLYEEICESIYSPPERVQFTTTRIIRDTVEARRLKKEYEFRCQICGERIELGSSSFYAEVHHIRPFGGGHGGLDAHDNMLVVCPTHHAMFDLGVATFSSNNLVSIGGTLHPLTLRHRIASENLAYHNDLYAPRSEAEW